ncbi:unnamed protein product [Effrenium voratum]|uniref:Uncharacterized protein n=1 Tax=Effrenium voratum TaxID=2562239 RepID=A0AA36JJQ8_9DINO|nr:unnamed protein product [Effrenium voratum]
MSTPTDADRRRPTPTDANRRRPTPTDADGRRRTPTDADGRPDGHTHPKVITKKIMAARSASEVLRVVEKERNNPKLDFFAMAAAWARMAKMPSRSISIADVLKDPFLAELIGITRSFAKSAGVEPKRNARIVANAFWAVAKLDKHMCSQLASLRSSLAQAAKQMAKHMEAQHVANTIYAAATLSESGDTSILSVLPALALQAEQVSSDMKAQEVANVIWATAKLSEAGENSLLAVLPALVVRAKKVSSDTKAQEVANMIWATAKLSDEGEDSLLALLPTLAVKAEEVSSDMTAQAVANVLSATAKLSEAGDDSLLAVLPTLAVRAKEVRSDMNSQDVANVIWATGKLSEAGGDSLLAVLPTLVGRAKEVSCDFIAQHVANVIWATGKLSEAGDDSLLALVSTLAIQAKQVTSDMVAQAVANVIWAAAKLSEAGDVTLLAVLPTLVVRAKEVRSDMSEQNVANVIWATAKLSEAGDVTLLAVLPTLAVRAKEVSLEMNAYEVANVIWATAKLSEVGDMTLLAVLPNLAVRAKEVRCDMTPQHVANVIWATAKLSEAGQESLLVVLPTLAVQAKEVSSDMEAQAVANTIWATAKLAEVGEDSLLAVLPTLVVRAKEVRSEMTAQYVASVIWAAAKLSETEDDCVRAVLPTLVGEAAPRRGPTRPRLITKRIMEASSAAEVLAVVQEERTNPRMDFIALSSAWTRLAKLAPSLADALADPFLPGFVGLTQGAAEGAGVAATKNARAVASTIWAVAKLDAKMRSHLASLKPSLALAAEHTAKHMDAQGVSNVIYAISTLSESGECSLVRLLPSLAVRVKDVRSAMTPQAMANVIWATAKLSESGETSLLPALPVLATQLKAVQCAMNAQDVANVIWATAKLSEAEDSLLALLPVLAARVEVVRTTMSAQHVASVIWAAGKLSQAGDDALLSVLPMVALRAEEVRSDMKRREVANMRWALERLPDHAGIADAVASLRQAFQAMGRRPSVFWLLAWLLSWHRTFVGSQLGVGRAESERPRVVRHVRERRVVSGRKARERSGKSDGHTAPRWITKRIMEAEQVSSDMKAQDVANVIWATAKPSEAEENSLLTVRPALVVRAKKVSSNTKAQEVANMIWAAAKLSETGYDSLLAVLPTLAVQVKEVSADMTAQEVANTIWATAKLSEAGDDSLLVVLPTFAAQVKEVSADMTAQEVANAIWATAKLSEAGDDSLLVVLPTLADQVREVSSDMKAQEVANVIWAAAKLSKAGDDALLAVLPTLADQVKEVSADMNAQAVANAIWAAAKLSKAGDDSLLAVLPTLALRAKEVRSEMHAQAVANIGWAMKQISDDAVADAVASLRRIAAEKQKQVYVFGEIEGAVPNWPLVREWPLVMDFWARLYCSWRLVFDPCKFQVIKGEALGLETGVKHKAWTKIVHRLRSILWLVIEQEARVSTNAVEGCSASGVEPFRNLLSEIEELQKRTRPRSNFHHRPKPAISSAATMPSACLNNDGPADVCNSDSDVEMVGIKFARSSKLVPVKMEPRIKTEPSEGQDRSEPAVTSSEPAVRAVSGQFCRQGHEEAAYDPFWAVKKRRRVAMATTDRIVCDKCSQQTEGETFTSQVGSEGFCVWRLGWNHPLAVQLGLRNLQVPVNVGFTLLGARGVSDSRGGGSESADSRIADSARLVRAGGAGSSSEIPSVPMPVFAPPNTEADLRELRQLIAEDVPFLIQWPEEHPLLPAEKYESVEAYLAKTLAEDGYKEDEEFLIVKFEECYSTSGPHVDAMFGSVNVYYMARGSKSVKILTRAATERLPMRYKDDYLRTENKEAEPAILDEKEWVDRAMTSPCSSNMDETLKVVEDGEEGPDQAAKDELKRLTFQKVYAHMGNEIPPEQLKNAIVVKTAKFHPITVIFLQVVTLGLFNFFRPKDDETLLVLTENGRVYLLKVERPNAFGVDIHAALMTFLRLVLLLALILTGPAFVVMVFGSSAVGDGDDFQLNNGNIVQQELDLDVKVYRKALHSTVLLVTVATTLLLIVGCWLYTNWPADYATRSRQSFKAETVSSIQYSISGSSVARSLKMRLYFGKYPGQARSAQSDEPMARTLLPLLLAWQLLRRDAFLGPRARGRGAEAESRFRVVRRVRERRGSAGRPARDKPGRSLDGYTHPKVITKKIMEAPSASEVLGVVRQERNNPKLDFIALSAAWARMAKMQASISAEVLSDPFLPDLIRLTRDGAGRAGVEAERNARAVANTYWAAAKLDKRMHSLVANLQSSLTQAAKQTANHMDEQEVANVIWAAAKLSEARDDSLLAVLPTLVVRAKEVSSDMNAQAVANVIWAAAKLSEAGDDSLLAVLPTLVLRAKEVRSYMNAQGVASIRWALKRLEGDASIADVLAPLQRVVR